MIYKNLIPLKRAFNELSQKEVDAQGAVDKFVHLQKNRRPGKVRIFTSRARNFSKSIH
jgi:hypothetical protein